MIRTFICLLGLIFLVACQAPQYAPFEVITYQNERPLLLPVGEIKIENQTTRYTELPHLETRIPVAPVSALSEALKNRFAAGNPNSDTVASIVIREADLIQKAKESDRWYILDNVEYLLSYTVDVIYARGSQVLEHQQFSGWEKQALPQKSSLSQKENAWQKMINAMIQKATQKIDADKPKSKT